MAMVCLLKIALGEPPQGKSLHARFRMLPIRYHCSRGHRVEPHSWNQRKSWLAAERHTGRKSWL